MDDKITYTHEQVEQMFENYLWYRREREDYEKNPFVKSKKWIHYQIKGCSKNIPKGLIKTIAENDDDFRFDFSQVYVRDPLNPNF